jgi:hypothetical protein
VQQSQESQHSLRWHRARRRAKKWGLQPQSSQQLATGPHELQEVPQVGAQEVSQQVSQQECLWNRDRQRAKKPWLSQQSLVQQSLPQQELTEPQQDPELETIGAAAGGAAVFAAGGAASAPAVHAVVINNKARFTGVILRSTGWWLQVPRRRFDPGKCGPAAGFS